MLILMATAATARDYVIYSITQDIPMGEPNEVIRKNYFINMGKSQGLREGAKISVFRTVSNQDPFDSNTRYNFKVPIGVLEVVHSESDAAITQKLSLNTTQNTPQFELYDFMIGDEVKVYVED